MILPRHMIPRRKGVWLLQIITLTIGTITIILDSTPLSLRLQALVFNIVLPKEQLFQCARIYSGCLISFLCHVFF